MVRLRAIRDSKHPEAQRPRPPPQVHAKKFLETLLAAVRDQKLPCQILQPWGRGWDRHSKLPTWITGSARPLPDLLLRVLDDAQSSWQSCPWEEVRPARFGPIWQALANDGVMALANSQLSQARETGIELAHNAPHRHDLRQPAAQVSDVWPTLSGAGFSLGHLLVDGIVARQWGSHGLQLSLPCLHLSMDMPPLGSSPVEHGEPMVRALVGLAWAVRCSTGETGLRLMTRMHKAESVEIARCTWWSRQCNSDREATVLVDGSITGPKATRAYAYLGGGSLSSASASGNLLQCIVVRARDWATGAAVMAIASDFASLHHQGVMAVFFTTWPSQA